MMLYHQLPMKLISFKYEENLKLFENQYFTIISLKFFDLLQFEAGRPFSLNDNQIQELKIGFYHYHILHVKLQLNLILKELLISI